MQHIQSSITPDSPAYRGGGRVSSPKLRKSLQQTEEFPGLDEDCSRYALLVLVKRAGQAAGFTPRMIELLDYYMSFTRDIDWEEGSSPIIYQSLARTALDLGISERQVQRLEQALFELGALTWNDSGNHRRYGQRCPETGEILFAFGVDLTPLAFLKDRLERKLEKKRAYEREWMEKKRRISWYRRQIRSLIAELEGVGAADSSRIARWETLYAGIAKPIRTYMGLEKLEATLGEHKSLHDILAKEATACIPSILSLEMSFRDAVGVVHYKDTTQKPSNELDTGKAPPKGFQERRNGTGVVNPVRSEQMEASRARDGDHALPPDTGLQHVTLKQALNAASERFRSRIPLAARPMNWTDFVEAAYRMRTELQIGQQSWARACMVLGRTGAALCVLLTDQAEQRSVDPVGKPAAYFNAMVNRAEKGELHLHRSIFGILKRESEAAS